MYALLPTPVPAELSGRLAEEITSKFGRQVAA